MDRMTRMVIRAYLPALIALLTAFTLLAIVSAMEGHRPVATWIPTLRWLPLAAFLYAFGYSIWITHRLWRRERGEARQVCTCGGLLGREQKGSEGTYRKCMACQRRVLSSLSASRAADALLLPARPGHTGEG